MKTAMRLWMREIQGYMGLRRRSSHGFRASFQAAEVHIALRSLGAKRSEWGATTRSCKLDIRKAYGIAAWRAVAALFERRQVPQELRSAYWRLHLDRTLMFRTADGTVTFRAVARRGMPQVSPENPMLDAARVEDLIQRAEQRLLVAQRPAGVRLDLAEEYVHQVELAKSKRPFGPTSQVYMNFADHTDVLGADAVDLSYATSVLAQELRSADQFLNSDECEVLTSEEEGAEDAPVRLWSDEAAAVNHRNACAWSRWQL